MKCHIENGVCNASPYAVDYLSTILDLLEIPQLNKVPIDGESFAHVLKGEN